MRSSTHRGRPVATRRFLLGGALLLLSGLPGCRLIDQTTFNPDAGKPPVIPKPEPPPPPAPTGPAALLTIPRQPEPDWSAALRSAVEAARRRKPSVAFDVVAVVPGAGTADEQVAAVQATGELAARIARAIQAAGIPPARVSLLARPDASATAQQVRVFVR